MYNYNIYCHIPFCKRKCPYCCFTSRYKPSEFTNLSLIDDYVEALIKDINNTEFPEGSIDSIVFGGGTPSLLSYNQLENIMSALKEKMSMERFNKLQYMSYEISPDTATLEKLNILKKNGFNRVSLGVQSFKDEELKLLKRPYTRKDILNTIENIKKCGYESMNIDILIGIPGQSFKSIMENIKEAIDLKIQNISVNIFYTLYKGGKEYFKKCSEENKTNESMNIEEKNHIYQEVSKVLLDANYKRIDNTVFALPNDLFEKSTTESTKIEYILAFGPGSSGFLGDTCRYTLASISNYIKEQRVICNKINAYQHGFVIAWVSLVSQKMIRQEDLQAYFGMDFEELLRKNKAVTYLLRTLMNEKVAYFEGTTFKLDPKHIDKAIILIQYIRGGNIC